MNAKKNNNKLMLAMLFLNSNNLRAKDFKENIKNNLQFGVSYQYKFIDSFYTGVIFDFPLKFKIGATSSYLFNNKIINAINISVLYDFSSKEKDWNFQIDCSIIKYVYSGLKFNMTGTTFKSSMFVIGLNYLKTKEKSLYKGFVSGNIKINDENAISAQTNVTDAQTEVAQSEVAQAKQVSESEQPKVAQAKQVSESEQAEQPEIAQAKQVSESEQPEIAQAEQPEIAQAKQVSESEQPKVAQAKQVSESEQAEQPEIAQAKQVSESEEQAEQPKVAQAKQVSESEQPEIAQAKQVSESEQAKIAQPKVAQAEQVSESKQAEVAQAEIIKLIKNNKNNKK